MPVLNAELLAAHRQKTYHLTAATQVKSPDQARLFIEERGFAFFWPVKGVDLPSLWVAANGDRPVADEHDDPGHITWDWKDKSLGKRWWYYGRLLKRKNTFLSLEAMSHFYALSPNYGSPEEDYLEEYEQGKMTQEARQVYETILKEGPIDTILLRKTAHLSSKESSSRFAKALDDLQIQMRVMPVGISDSGAWHYSFMYDIVPRHFPEIIESAGKISESAARLYILRGLIQSVGAARVAASARLLGWELEVFKRNLNSLAATGEITLLDAATNTDPEYALTDLVQ